MYKTYQIIKLHVYTRHCKTFPSCRCSRCIFTFVLFPCIDDTCIRKRFYSHWRLFFSGTRRGFKPINTKGESYPTTIARKLVMKKAVDRPSSIFSNDHLRLHAQQLAFALETHPMFSDCATAEEFADGTIFDLCLRKNWSGTTSFSKSSVFRMFSVYTKMQSWRFQIPLV